ncbi:MAG: M56 family metallopeptidase [Sedimentisphaerales bacterium]|nr:M56 family metallopeptidase [Sedimentisphaerales bacterium]
MPVALAMPLGPFFAWLLSTTCQASVLVLLILLIRMVAGRWLGVRGRYCLWLILVVRMAMPWAPASGLSLYNLLPLSTLLGREARVTPVDHAARAVLPPRAGGQRDAGVLPVAATTPADPLESPRRSARVSATWAIPFVWLAGVCGLAGWIVVNGIRLCRIVRRGRIVQDRWVLNVLEECKDLMGVGTALDVVVTDKVGCPALCGLLRPRMLMPKGLLAERDRNEIRHIFLHELAHMKRYDLLTGHIVSLLHVLHWFNPVIALGFRQMRLDRELACDGLALSTLHRDETRAYGHTIVRHMERLLTSRRRTLVPALCGDRNQIKQRIAMIASFQRAAYRRSRFALVLLAVLALIGLTNGRAVDRLADSTPSPPATVAGETVVIAEAEGAEETQSTLVQEVRSTLHHDKHGNIIRIHIRHKESGKYLVTDGTRITCNADEPGEAGLWEARFDDDLGFPQFIVFFYSVAAGGYLTSDERGNLAIRRTGPDDATRWTVATWTKGTHIKPYPHEDLCLNRHSDKFVAVVRGGDGPPIRWEIDQVWRIKVSDKPTSNAEWRRKNVPGPD